MGFFGSKKRPKNESISSISLLNGLRDLETCCRAPIHPKLRKYLIQYKNLGLDVT